MASKTNPIPKGTTNISLNIPQEERDLWGQLFVSNPGFSSLGDAIKQMALEGLSQHHPDVAAQIRDVRTSHRARVLDSRYSPTSTSTAATVSNDEPPPSPPPAAKKKFAGISPIEGAKRATRQASRRKKK